MVVLMRVCEELSRQVGWTGKVGGMLTIWEHIVSNFVNGQHEVVGKTTTSWVRRVLGSDDCELKEARRLLQDYLVG